jgi:putative membrane protein
MQYRIMDALGRHVKLRSPALTAAHKEQTLPEPTDTAHPPRLGVTRMLRTALGGVLMGVANLIPGVSGGTMILAIGLYEEFIDAVADVTALRLSVRRIVFLGLMGLAAVGAIVGLSGVILHLLLWHAVIMFALFIGLTLGGAPLLMRMIGKPTAGCIVAVVVGIGLMAGIAAARNLGDLRMPRNAVMDVTSGVVGATTMVLPGISGSYMLLILDQYDRVVGAVADLKDGSWSALAVIIPVGIGAVIGVVGLSNLLKWLLHRHEQVTLGFLLGMLLGSVIGLWPFSQPPTEKILQRASDQKLHEYAAREGIAGAETLTGEDLVAHIEQHWPQRTAPAYAPAKLVQAVIALVAGLVVTFLIGRLGAPSTGTEAHEASG